MTSAIVFGGNGGKSGNENLPAEFFDVEPNEHLIYEAVKMYRANKRTGTHSTKNRSAVAGGGAKPWRQKGTGRARQGTIRAPQWVGGGRAFGPSPKDYSYSIPKKMRYRALVSTLTLKARGEGVVILDEFSVPEPKTRIIAALLQKMNLSDKKCLLLVDNIDENLRLAARNIKNLRIKPTVLVNAHDVIASDILIFTRAGLDKLEERKGK